MQRHQRSVLSLEPLEGRIAPALSTTLTWQGDRSSSAWSDGTVGTDTNWITNLGAQRIPLDSNLLVFPAAPAGNKTNNNDINGLDLKSLTFNGDGYTIGGTSITLSNGLKASYSTTGSNFFAAKITLVADQTFAFSGNTGANFSFGSIDLAGKALTIDNTFTVQIAPNATVLSGTGVLTKNGAGQLDLFAGNTFIGPVQVNAGVLQAVFSSALGAVGEGNGTTVASGATLSLNSFISTFAEDLTLNGVGASGQSGALVLQDGPGSGGDVDLTGALRLGADAAIKIGSLRSLTLSGAVGAADDALAILTATVGANGQLAFANTATFTTELAGTTPGASGHDRLKVIGPVNLGGAALNVVPSFTPAIGDKFTIVDNDGTDPIVGTFAGLADNTIFPAGGINFKINYAAGTSNNDVVLTVDSFVETPLPVTLSTDAKTATFTDRDGDLVTVKTNKGPFQQGDFKVIEAGVGGQLQQINLTTHSADFAGANLTITAKPGPLGGNGFVNVGYINATGIDLGTVKIGGDLGRIAAGTLGGDVKVPAIKSLDVGSIAILGTSTQTADGSPFSNIAGGLTRLLIKGDLRGGFILSGDDGKLGSATIGGSVVAIAAGPFSGPKLNAEAGIGTVRIAGDIRAASGRNVNIESRKGAIGSVKIGGSIVGAGSGSEVFIAAFGQSVAPARGSDLAIQSLDVAGSVEWAQVSGGLTTQSSDASIGTIRVGGDWIATSVTAGTRTGNDTLTGTEDDLQMGGRDNPNIFSSIGNITIKGQAFGTASPTNDMFGIVAERIGKAKVGGRTFAFKDGTNEAFFAAPTLDGEGAESPSPMFDFTIRELGSTTPTVTLSRDFALSNGDQTATFTDVDGDQVTVTRTLGQFLATDFGFAGSTLSGGGQLKTLRITAAPGNLTIAATPGPNGGNGFVNVGAIDASGVPLSTVRVAGDLGKFDGGLSIGGKAGITAFNVHSLGVLGTSTGASFTGSFFTGGLGKLTVATDVRDASVSPGGSGDKIGAVTIGGSFIFTGSPTFIGGGDGLGTVTIGGSVRGGQLRGGNGSIGAITIKGDLIGVLGGNATIGTFGRPTAPATGLDVAITSLTVKGNVENARIEAGAGGTVTNADASIGAIKVGRAWLASSVLAGVANGGDSFIGTSDDKKAIGTTSTRDELLRFSTIASITIKSQAFGSTTANDSFGIVAEQILKAKIGTRTLKFAKGERSLTDAFAIGVTGPGAAPDNSLTDFFIREITV